MNPYLTFNGQCEAAFKFYERCLGGKIEFMLTNGDSPMADQVPPEWRNKIMHALCLAKIPSASSGVPPRVAVVRAADTGK